MGRWGALQFFYFDHSNNIPYNFTFNQVMQTKKKKRKECEKEHSNCVQICVYLLGEQRWGAENKGGMDICMYACVCVFRSDQTIELAAVPTLEACFSEEERSCGMQPMNSNKQVRVFSSFPSTIKLAWPYLSRSATHCVSSKVHQKKKSIFIQ